MPAKKSAVKKTPARKRAAAVKKTPANSMTFEEFKKQVIKESMEFDGGCYDGKKTFLENLGLEVPPRQGILKLEIIASYGEGDHTTKRINLQNKLATLLEESDLDVKLYSGISWQRWADE